MDGKLDLVVAEAAVVPPWTPGSGGSASVGGEWDEGGRDKGQNKGGGGGYGGKTRLGVRPGHNVDKHIAAAHQYIFGIHRTGGGGRSMGGGRAGKGMEMPAHVMLTDLCYHNTNTSMSSSSSSIYLVSNLHQVETSPGQLTSQTLPQQHTQRIDVNLMGMKYDSAVQIIIITHVLCCFISCCVPFRTPPPCAAQIVPFL